MTVRTATADDLPEVAALLAAAFHDDPLSRWLFPGAARRWEVQPAFLGTFATLAVASGGMVSLRHDGAAATVWLPGGAAEDDLSHFGMLTAEEAERFVRLSELMADNRPDHGEHMHLQLIAVHPDHQRRGVGGELLAHDLACVDARGTPAYLEASSWLSTALYRRHGFVFTGKPFGPEPRTRMYPMWRER